MADPARNYIERRLADRIDAAHGVVTTLETDPDVRAAFAAYDFDDEEIAQGRALFDAALANFKAQPQEYGEQYVATARKKTAASAAYEEWKRLAGLARLLFKRSPADLAALGVADLPDAFADRLARYRQFATAARTPERLALRSVKPGTLNAFDALVDAADTAGHDAHGEAVEAQDATATRDDVFGPLDDYVLDVQDLGRIALKDRPQLLEKLGLVVR